MMSNWRWMDALRRVTGYSCCTPARFIFMKCCAHNGRQCYLQNSFLFVLQFCPECKLSEDSEFYNTSPAANDRVHVLVCVVPADTGNVTKEKILRKIKEIRKEATVRGESLPVCWLGRGLVLSSKTKLLKSTLGQTSV